MHTAQFFSSVIGRPPTSTLFPYTTLFRSGQTIVVRAAACVAIEAMEGTDETLRRAGRLAKGDRKSTRLNSSHSSISSAVFCLKKKQDQRQSRVTNMRR